MLFVQCQEDIVYSQSNLSKISNNSWVYIIFFCTKIIALLKRTYYILNEHDISNEQTGSFQCQWKIDCRSSKRLFLILNSMSSLGKSLVEMNWFLLDVLVLLITPFSYCTGCVSITTSNIWGGTLCIKSR